VRNEWEKLICGVMVGALLIAGAFWLFGGDQEQVGRRGRRSIPSQSSLFHQEAVNNVGREVASVEFKGNHPFFTEPGRFKKLLKKQKSRPNGRPEQPDDDEEDDDGRGKKPDKPSEKDTQPPPEETDEKSPEPDQKPEKPDKPSDKAPKEAAPPEPPPVKITYLGLMEKGTERAYAYIRLDQGDSKAQRFVRVGAKLGKYRVVNFTEDKLVLEEAAGGMKKTVKFKETSRIRLKNE